MTKENLEILEFEDKKTQAGKRYTRFKTSEGWMSCFDKKSCEALKDFEGKTAKVEVAEANGFKNIRRFLGEASEDEESEEYEPKSEKKSKFEGEKPANLRESFPVSMKVSYAKDLIIGKGMKAEDAVKMVKDLIAGFEAKPMEKKAEEKIEVVRPGEAKEEFPDY
ncbi:MAG: hypothetical protein M0R35_07135 [Candidatus Omnitrophica bacterium]|nr:hypothetical protein [Candidatus Omnitrophota bacterium]